MDRLTQLLQKSYQTPRELTPPAGSWDRLARDLTRKQRQRRLLWWFFGSALAIACTALLFSGHPPSLGAFPIAETAQFAQGELAPQPPPKRPTAARVGDRNSLATSPQLIRPASDLVPTVPEFSKPSPTAATSPAPSASATERTTQAAVASGQQPKLAVDHSAAAEPSTTPGGVYAPARVHKRDPAIVPPQFGDTLGVADLPPQASETSTDSSKGLMEEVDIPPPPRKNAWRFFVGGQQRVDGIVLMTYTDYPLIRQQQPLKRVANTDLYALSFASAQQRSTYLELGAAFQHYRTERLSFNYQLSFFSGSFASDVLAPYVRVNTEHYRETGVTTIRALQAEYGLAWDWLNGPRLRLAPYAGLLYQFTLQSQYQATLSTPGQGTPIREEARTGPPHVTDEFRLRVGGLLHLPLQADWELSVAVGITTEFLDIPRPAIYGNIGIGRAF